MALTKVQVREILSAAGVPTENVSDAVDKIMDGHVTSINALREERDGFKADAEKLGEVQKELDDLKAKDDGTDWKAKFTEEHENFEKYKTTVSEETANKQKSDLYEKVLRAAGIDEKRMKSIMRVVDLSKVTVKDGKLDDEEKILEGIKTEWADFISTSGSKHTQPDTPPEGGSPTKTSRASKLAAEYHNNMYGKEKGES